MFVISEKEIAKLKENYPVGTKIRLLAMDDIQAPPVGTEGVVCGVDGTGSLLVHWKNGSSLNVLYGVDQVEKV